MKVNKNLIILMALFLLVGTPYSNAKDGKPEHLLDGTTLEYYYQNGSGISIDFYDGKLRYEWIAGPPKGNMGKDIPYRSRKIGDEMYIVNFHEKHKPDFVTLIFNLKQNVMYSSAILRYGTDKEMISFSGGIVEHVKR
ncbi:MAG: MoaF N-terminal domain-containing protein [Deltaproteobacteria bacterium]|nr:MoaF N-terminal domain-containing protein [Deltaproteobacteria bacterium]